MAEHGESGDASLELEWLATISNLWTRQTYKTVVREFSTFIGLTEPAQMRTVTRAHIISWREAMAVRGVTTSSVRSKLSALSSLFQYLRKHDAIAENPMEVVKRGMANPKPESKRRSRKKPGVAQVRKLLEAPSRKTVKGLRDRAILAVLLFYGVSRAELCRLLVGDVQNCGGIAHLRVTSRRKTIRFVPIHAKALKFIEAYLAVAKHGGELAGPLFRPTKNNRTGVFEKHLDPGGIYRNVVQKYGKQIGIEARVNLLCVYSKRSMVVADARLHEADVAKAQG